MAFKNALQQLDASLGQHTNSLSSKMAGLRLNNAHTKPPRDFRSVATARPRPDLVEISDDSDSIEPSRHQYHRSPLQRPDTPDPRVPVGGGSISDPAMLSDSDETFSLDQPARVRARPTKRPKLHHEHHLQPRDKVSPPTRPFKTEQPERLPDIARRGHTRPHPDYSDYSGPLQPAARTKEETEPPYYYDAELDMHMYRGSGFERFPVAIGTFEGHKELCEKWDREPAAISQVSQSVDLSPQESHFRKCEDQALSAALEILPDIEHAFVREQFNLLSRQNPQLAPEQLSADLLISHFLELPDYNKADRKDKKPTTEPSPDGTGVTIPFNKHFQQRPSYLKEAVMLLAWQFRHVPTCYIFKVVEEKTSIYESYLHIHALDTNYYSLPSSQRPYRRMKQPRQNIEKKYTKKTHELRDHEAYPHWINEIQAAKQHIERETIKSNEKQKDAAAEEANLEQHRANGWLVECRVCFDTETPMNRAVICTGENGHFFCFSCVAQLAETQAGMLKYEMLCMDESGCKAALDPEGVGQAVPIKTVDRLALNQQQAEIAAADLEGLEQCPYCEFRAIMDPVETAVVFQCFNPDCRRASCRKCRQDAHVPKSCEEVRAERGLSERHLVEEARSESVMRPCPKCKVKIMKEHGCNKMACTQCGCLMCYLCKIDISRTGYEHFNKPGSKCQLYDRNTNALHDEEADAAELEAIKKVKAQNADLDVNLLQIETGKAKKPRAQPDNDISAGLALEGDRHGLQQHLADLHVAGQRLRDVAAAMRALPAGNELPREPPLFQRAAGMYGPGAVAQRAQRDQRAMHEVARARAAVRGNAGRQPPPMPEMDHVRIDQARDLPNFNAYLPAQLQLRDNQQQNFHGLHMGLPDLGDYANFPQREEQRMNGEFARWEADLDALIQPLAPPALPAQHQPPQRPAYAGYPLPARPPQPHQALNAVNLDQLNDQNEGNGGGGWARLYGWLPFNFQ
ncbi:uncharacterized protein HMPREF1541_03998 [Cyphellophora europaea CBS 101466]|uniref:RING-type domain-containing protein n=1 Tax=Cyphellophora europaea (strain CBS 101466) TaxID=1220924 RepID=W2S277_CYPE1|nr:uncharacterized protein HMPREF1541_03998 [Cyphellophora europaea CBS 101466]ETN42059.1 hypothetical protein HMPREF1541_03998 [Cyphellophora europaea CBS 101466]